MYRPSLKNFVIYCLLILYWSVQFCFSSPYGKEIVHSHKNSVSGCLHNSTMFADTSIVPSTEPCLVCKCSKRNLVCVRRVCKDQPYPPPRGCILVQKKSLCCPYLSCSKYHVNFYKNAERNREHVYNNYQATHEKTLEKHSRTDDDDAHPHNYDDMNGGCIESGSLYASGSAMYRSSASLCTYCYCINGQQKCIKPKCMLKTSRCKPILMEGSCCPIKYDCSHNSTAHQIPSSVEMNEKILKKKIDTNVCYDGNRSYQEGERLPLNDQRPCEVCYCIKGARKCAVKKCAPVIHGCVPKVPAHGACCPTSYDCRRRSLKFKRESRQEDEDEVEEDGDTIDFFSLLFGSDDPKEEEVTEEITTTVAPPTTLPPFKSLPSTTESSFFDLIRAGLEIIDANADKIDSQINKVISTTPVASSSSTEQLTTVTESTRKTFETSTPSSEIKTSASSSISETKKLPSSTEMPKTSPLPTSSSRNSSTKLPTTASLLKVSTQRTTLKTTIAPAVKMSSTTLAAKKPETTTRKITSKAPSSTTMKSIARTTISPPKTTLLTSVKTTMKKATTTTPLPRTTTIKKVMPSTKRPPPPTMAPQKFIVPSLVETLQKQRLPSIVHFNADVLPDTKYSPSSGNDEHDNEADALPNLEIIPFVAHDAIRTDKYEPYLSQPYEHALEKDYFANNEGGVVVSGYETEKPFRYNNKFIHHNYDDSLDYVYTNPHDRIDNGPYYFENQFESFSPPNEQDFLGGFSPKDTVYDEVSTSTKLPIPPALPSHHNDSHEKTLNTSAIHEHKSSEKTAATLAINQTLASDVKHQQQQTTTVPGFKKISSNFTSFIDDLLQVNALDEATKAPLVLSTITTSTTIKSTSTNAPIKSIINDDDFIKKHLKATSTSTTFSKSSQKQQQQPPPSLIAPVQQQQMEIFSKPTNPTMNGLLKLAGCNIYGQMYEVGNVIPELSNPCYECKCLPDIGVGCMPLC